MRALRVRDKTISMIESLIRQPLGMNEIRVDGAVVVTTPQEVSMADVRKELNFCKKTGLDFVCVSVIVLYQCTQYILFSPYLW